MDRRIQENHKLAQTLKDRFKQKEALIGVIGLGYVGLPICIAAGESGSKVLGFDVDPAKSKAVTQGRSYLNHISDYRIASGQRGAVDRDDVLSRLSEPDALLTATLQSRSQPDRAGVRQTEAFLAKSRRAHRPRHVEAHRNPPRRLQSRRMRKLFRQLRIRFRVESSRSSMLWLPAFRRCLITAVAPTTSTLRKPSSSARVMTPSLTFPAVE